MRAGAEAARLRTNASGRVSRLVRIRTRKRGSDPMRGIRMGAGAALFVWNRFQEKESGPDISARPAYIRGANDRIRTGDLRFTRALLYQLSHVGTRLLAKREYELYRRACRFARGKCNFSGERAGIRRFSTGLHPSVATMESRIGARSIAAVTTAENRPNTPFPRDSPTREPHEQRALESRPSHSMPRRTASPPTPRPRGPSPPARGPGPRATHSCSRCPACRAERPNRGCP